MMMLMMMMHDDDDDDDDDDDIQVSYFFKPRRPLMQEVSTSFIAGGLYLCYC